jgi:hypothetical protein
MAEMVILMIERCVQKNGTDDLPVISLEIAKGNKRKRPT